MLFFISGFALLYLSCWPFVTHPSAETPPLKFIFQAQMMGIFLSHSPVSLDFPLAALRLLMSVPRLSSRFTSLFAIAWIMFLFCDFLYVRPELSLYFNDFHWAFLLLISLLLAELHSPSHSSAICCISDRRYESNCVFPSKNLFSLFLYVSLNRQRGARATIPNFISTSFFCLLPVSLLAFFRGKIIDDALIISHWFCLFDFLSVSRVYLPGAILRRRK